MRKKLHVFLRSHSRNHMVLPPVYLITQRSRKPAQIQGVDTWTSPTDGRTGSEFVATS